VSKDLSPGFSSDSSTIQCAARDIHAVAQPKLRTNFAAIPLAIFRNWRSKNNFCEARVLISSRLPDTVVSSFHTSGTGVHLTLLSDAVCNSAEHADPRDMPHKYRCRALSYTTQHAHCRTIRTRQQVRSSKCAVLSHSSAIPDPRIRSLSLPLSSQPGYYCTRAPFARRSE